MVATIRSSLLTQLNSNQTAANGEAFIIDDDKDLGSLRHGDTDNLRNWDGSKVDLIDPQRPRWADRSAGVNSQIGLTRRSTLAYLCTGNVVSNKLRPWRPTSPFTLDSHLRASIGVPDIHAEIPSVPR